MGGEKIYIRKRKNISLCRAARIRRVRNIRFVFCISWIYSFCLFAETPEEELAKLIKRRDAFVEEYRTQGSKKFSSDKKKYFVICWSYAPFCTTGGVRLWEDGNTFYVVGWKTKDRKIAARFLSNDIMDLPQEYYPMCDFFQAKEKRHVYCLLLKLCNRLEMKSFYWDNIISPLEERITELSKQIDKEKEKNEYEEDAVPDDNSRLSNGKGSQRQQKMQPASSAPDRTGSNYPSLTERDTPKQIPVKSSRSTRSVPPQIVFNSGNPKADEQLAFCVEYFQKGDPESLKKAAEFARKSADLGSPEAQWLLGQFYQMGTGVQPDMQEAVKWFRKSAEQGNPKAQRSLGGCYIQGKGVAQDPVEAVKWFRMAAKQYDADAQFILGCCYASGLGVKKDLTEAEKWLKYAADQGHPKAKEIYEKIQQQNN